MILVTHESHSALLYDLSLSNVHIWTSSFVAQWLAGSFSSLNMPLDGATPNLFCALLSIPDVGSKNYRCGCWWRPISNPSIPTKALEIQLQKLILELLQQVLEAWRLFIHQATVPKFIGDPNYRPTDRLDILIAMNALIRKIGFSRRHLAENCREVIGLSTWKWLPGVEN